MVKQWNDLKDKYKKEWKYKYWLKLPYIYFIPEMKPLCGKLWTITKIYWSGSPEVYYEILFDDKKIDWKFLFVKEMLIVLPANTFKPWKSEQ
jgi:hypothetical protein